MSGVSTGEDGRARCWWCQGDSLYLSYHDLEWGRPVTEDNRLFEKICLEGFQSGLSWLTILRKRENFRRAFNSFDIETVAHFDERTVERLLSDPRERAPQGKDRVHDQQCSSVYRADRRVREPRHLRVGIRTRATLTTLDVGLAHAREPGRERATALSKELKRRGWSFVGPTTVYSFMEAVGLVNDHMTACDFREEVEDDHYLAPGFAVRATGRLPRAPADRRPRSC